MPKFTESTKTMSHEIAFYEFIEIVIAVIALGLEGYAYYQDNIWDKWLHQFGFNLGKMCEAFGKRTSDLVPLLSSTGFFGDMENGKVHIQMFRRNSSGETWFLVTEVLAIIFTCLHLVYSFKSNRNVLKAKYGAYIHGLIFAFLVPTSLSLITTAYEVENGYKLMANYHPQCINIIFCKEAKDLQDEIDESKADDIQRLFTDLQICQMFWVKISAAVFGAIQIVFSLGIVFVAMSVITRYEDDSSVDVVTATDEIEDFFRTISRRPSKSHHPSESNLKMSQSEETNRTAMSSHVPSRFFPSRDDEDDKSKTSIQDLLLVRKLSPVTLYKEYKFRKQRVAEMEREQTMAQDLGYIVERI